MTRQAKVWLVVVAALYFFVNLAGAAYAFWRWELLHASVHAALVILGAYVVGRRAARRIESYENY